MGGNVGHNIGLGPFSNNSDTSITPQFLLDTTNGRVGINTTSPNCQLTVAGLANIHNGSPYAVSNNFMQSGSLTIGGTNANYGNGNNWSGNTAGLMMECQDITEIMIHDAGNRLASFMRYYNNNFLIGRDAGWGIASTSIAGSFSVSGSAAFYEDTTVYASKRLGFNESTYANWFIFTGTSPTSVVNSLIFHHSTSTINSKWWFNGTQTSTNSEISDERIKKEIQEIENPLNKLMLLKPKQYMLCDEKDYLKKYGIIAQDVNKQDELNHLVYIDNDYISDIYCKASFNEIEGKYLLTTEKNINNIVNVNDEIKILLDNMNIENTEIIIEDTPYHNRYKKRYGKIKSIIDEYTIEIYDNIELTETEKQNIFIYGTKTNDFNKLDYSSLYTLNIAATQELYKLIQQQNILIEDLKNRISILEQNK